MKIKTRQNEDTILHLLKIKITMTTAAINHPKEMKTKLIQDQEEKVRYPKEILEKEVLKIAIVIVIEAEDTLMIAMIPNPGKDLAEMMMKKRGCQRNHLCHQDAKDMIQQTTMTMKKNQMKDLADVIAILQMIAKNIKTNPDQQILNITMTLQKMTKEKLNQKGIKKNLRTSNLKIVRDILNVQEIKKVAGAAEKIEVRFIPDQNISMMIAADEMIRCLMVK